MQEGPGVISGEDKWGVVDDGMEMGMPRWADDPVRRLEMLGWIQVMPRWAEDPMRWLSWVIY